MPRAHPIVVVKPGHGASRTQTQDVRMRLGLSLNHSHGSKLLDCASQSRGFLQRMVRPLKIIKF